MNIDTAEECITLVHLQGLWVGEARKNNKHSATWPDFVKKQWKMEWDSVILFLENNIYRNVDGSLGHKVQH
jgi:hypothetical protein